MFHTCQLHADRRPRDRVVRRHVPLRDSVPVDHGEQAHSVRVGSEPRNGGEGGLGLVAVGVRPEAEADARALAPAVLVRVGGRVVGLDHCGGARTQSTKIGSISRSRDGLPGRISTYS